MGPVGTVLILLIIFGSITSIILGAMHLRNKNKERMAILSQGADPGLFRDEYKAPKNSGLKIGILCIAIAVGIIIGYIIESNFFVPESVAYFSAIFMCGGIGLLIGSFIDKQEDKK